MRVTHRSALALTGVLTVAMLGVIPASAELDTPEGTRINSLIADSGATAVSVSGTATFVDTPVMTMQWNKVSSSVIIKGLPNPYLVQVGRPDPFGNTLRLTVHSAVDDDAYAPWQGTREMFEIKFALREGEWDYDNLEHNSFPQMRYFRASVVTNDPVASMMVTGSPGFDSVFYLQRCKYFTDNATPGDPREGGGPLYDDFLPTQEGCASALNASTEISGTLTRTENEIMVEWDLPFDAIDANADTYFARCDARQWNHAVYNAWGSYVWPLGNATGGGYFCNLMVTGGGFTNLDVARNYIVPVPEVRMGIAPVGTPVSEVGLTVTGQVESGGSFGGQLPAPAQPGEYLIVAEACYDGYRDFDFEPVRNNCDVSTTTVTR